jgi:hypothetical protein
MTLTQRSRRALYALGLGALLALCWGGAVEWSHERRAHAEAEFRAQSLLRLNDSTTARYMRLRGEKDSLAALYAAAKQMKGKLIAGIQINVPPETLKVPVPFPVETVIKDSTRIGTLTDSVRGYTVKITAVAPPFPANLKIGYEIATPPFNPQVGIVERSDGYFAVVHWNGQRSEAGYAFYTPPKKRRFVPLIGNQVWVANDPKNPIGFDAFAGLRVHQSKWETMLALGQRRSPYVGLSMIRTF